MRKMFVALALICAIPGLQLHAQFVNHTTIPQWYDLLRVDKLFWINTRDTTGYAAANYPGAIVFRQQAGDTAHYGSNGKNWVKLGASAPTLQQVTGAGSITTDSVSVRSVTASNTSSDEFVPYYKFGHAGQDSISWQLGLKGKQKAFPPNAGDALTLRSYLPTGAFLRDEMIIGRGGGVTFSGSIVTNGLRVGASPPTPYATGIVEINGSLGINGTLAVTKAVVITKSIFLGKTVTVTGNYIVTDDDLYINVDNTEPCIITLPPVNTLAFGFGDGRVLYIKKVNNNDAPITINISQTLGNASGTQTIDGASTYLISGAWEAHHFHDSGANWFVY